MTRGRLAALLIATAVASGASGVVLGVYGLRPPPPKLPPKPVDYRIKGLTKPLRPVGFPGGAEFDPTGMIKPGEVARAALPGDTLASVDGVEITRADALGLIADEMAESAVERLIDLRLLEREADRLEVEVDPAELEREMGAIAGTVVSGRFHGKRHNLQAYLRNTGRTEAEWKESFRVPARERVLQRAVVAALRRPSEEDLRRAWEEAYGPGGRRRTVRSLLVSTTPGLSSLYDADQWKADREANLADAKRLAADARAALVGGETLAVVASRFPDGPPGLASGIVGAASHGRFGPDFDRVAEALAEGVVADELVVSPHGVHVILCPGIAEEQAVSYRVMRFALGVLVDPHAHGESGSRAAKMLAAAKEAALERAGEFLDVVRGGTPWTPAAARAADADGEGGDGFAEIEDAWLSAAPEALRGPLATTAIGEASDPVLVGSNVLVVQPTARTRHPDRDRKTIGHILVATDYRSVKARKLAGTIEALAEKRAQELLAEAKTSPKRFAELAATANEDPAARASKGLLTEVDLKRHGEDFVVAIDALEVGGPPTLVRSRDGFHIVELVKATDTPFEIARDGLLAKLTGEPPTRSEILKVIANLRARARIVIAKRLTLTPSRPKEAPPPPGGTRKPAAGGAGGR